MEEEHFESGAKRDTAVGKPRFDLFCPFAMEAIGRVLAEGEEHYGRLNWAKGIPLSRCMESLQRHLQQFLEGQNNEDHLAHAACNIMFMLSYIERRNRHQILTLGGKQYPLPDSIYDLPLYAENKIPVRDEKEALSEKDFIEEVTKRRWSR